MASPAASPPAASPAADVKPVLSRPPSLCMKPAQTPPAMSPTSPASTTAPRSLTTKEWIIPPRPKPGRKPATDTPPTKRKAQNRAAQRAFRERRAARVGELEEQLKQVEEENENDQQFMKRRIEQLEQEVEHYRADLASWVARCRKLEAELDARKPSSPSQKLPSKPSAPPGNDPAIGDAAANDTSVGCGNCTLETRCQCIDDAFDAMGGEAAANSHQREKRPQSPLQAVGEKRVKLEPQDSIEIDFTSAYASKSTSALARVTDRSPTAAVTDPCGFCSDGTPCICAEMAAEEEQAQHGISVPAGLSRSALPSNPPRQLDQFTPPPSEGDVSISISTGAAAAGCASGPGTCAQCRADPNSTLFCKSLAASRERTAANPAGCCGGPTPGGACCQKQPNDDSVPLPPRKTRSRAAPPLSQGKSHPASPAKAGVTLTCADAFTTLSRHPAYERASGDIATWLPKLHASEASSSIGGRPALEIDAANVMAVLKDFDRRFGQSR